MSCSSESHASARIAVGGGLVVETYGREEDFVLLAPEWRALMETSRLTHPFYDPAWYRCWWKHLGSGQLYILVLRTEDGEMRAVAPLVLGESGLLRLCGGEDLSDYLDILAREDCHEETWRAFLAYLEGDEAPAWSEFLLRGVPDDSPTRAVLAKLTGGRARAEQEDVCPVITLPDSWEDYRGMLDSRDERDLRRKVRKAHMEPGLEFTRTLARNTLEADLNTFVELHALSQPEKADFWNEKRGAFFREMAAEMLERGWLDLTFMRVDGHAVASNFSFDYQDRIYLYNSGYDPVERELSGGLVLLVNNIEEAINAGRAKFDMLRGDEAYKYRFAAQDEPVWRIRLQRGEP